MTPILDRPDDRTTVKYLQEENALLKDACIRERTGRRKVIELLDAMLKDAECDEETLSVMITATTLTALKRALDL